MALPHNTYVISGGPTSHFPQVKRVHFGKRNLFFFFLKVESGHNRMILFKLNMGTDHKISNRKQQLMSHVYFIPPLAHRKLRKLFKHI